MSLYPDRLPKVRHTEKAHPVNLESEGMGEFTRERKKDGLPCECNNDKVEQARQLIAKAEGKDS